MNTEILYLLRDNASYLVVTEAGDPLASLSFVTRVLVIIGGVTFDSDILGSTKIWWTDQVDYDGAGTLVDVIKFKLGQDVTLPADKYEDCRLVLYDAGNPNGVVFTSSMTVYVR